MNVGTSLIPLENCSMKLQTFEARELTIMTGIKVYLRCTVGEFLTDDQIQRLCDNLSMLRMRPREGNFPSYALKIVSQQPIIRSRYIPRKMLRKDELAVLIYNLAPYSFLTRKETAFLAKGSFPCFFSKSSTIYGTFTKYLGSPITERGNEIFFTITNFPFHSTVKLEEEMIKLALEINKQ